MMIEKTNVSIVGRIEDIPTKCPECRALLAVKGELPGIRLLTCNALPNEIHRLWLVSEWLGIHITQAMDGFITAEELSKPHAPGEGE